MKLKEVDIDNLKTSRKESTVFCIPEMMSLFECYERHDFDPQRCMKQSEVLEKCYAAHKAAANTSKDKRLNKASN